MHSPKFISFSLKLIFFVSLDTAQPQDFVPAARIPREVSSWSSMDRHIRWAQLLLYLWLTPSRRGNSQKSQCC